MRGMQYPDVTNLCFSQFEPGSDGLWNQAMIWSIEDSCQNGYRVEQTLSGPPPSSGTLADPAAASRAT
jgi:hypothetical protein